RRPRSPIVSATPLDRMMVRASRMPDFGRHCVTSLGRLTIFAGSRQALSTTKKLGTHSAGKQLRPYAFNPTTSAEISSGPRTTTPFSLIFRIFLTGLNERWVTSLGLGDCTFSTALETDLSSLRSTEGYSGSPWRKS